MDDSKTLFASIGILAVVTGLVWLALDGGGVGAVVAAMTVCGALLLLRKYAL